MEIVIGVVVVAALLLSSKKKAGGGEPPAPPPAQSSDAGKSAAQQDADNLNGILSSTLSAAGTVAGLTAGIVGKFAAGGTATATTTTTAVTTTTTGGTATSTGGVGSVTGGASGSATSAEIAGEIGVTLTAAEVAAEAAVFAAFIAVIVAMILLDQYGQAYFPADVFRTGGAKKRMGFIAYQTETEIIVKLCKQAGAPIRLGQTAPSTNGLVYAEKDSAGRDLTPYRIPVINGQTTEFIESFPADKDVQRLLLDLARWWSWQKVGAQNEYLNAYYFVRRYEAVQADGNKSPADAVAITLNLMEQAGVALRPELFTVFRDGYIADRVVCPWKMKMVAPDIVALRLGQTGVTREVDTVFNDPPLYWQECVNVAKARIPNADLIAAQLRVVGHGDGLTVARFHSDNTFSLEEQKRTLVKLGYQTRPSAQWPGELDYVDTKTGWFFTPRMVLRDSQGNIIQERMS